MFIHESHPAFTRQECYELELVGWTNPGTPRCQVIRAKQAGRAGNPLAVTGISLLFHKNTGEIKPIKPALLLYAFLNFF